MLQTDEVEDDYFTPLKSTSLANIFVNTQDKQGTDIEQLKYTPTKAQNLQKQNIQSKSTECLFACAVIGHEWSDNIYTSRGKLGFAIIKIQKSGDHSIVLYDTNKATLSCTTVSEKLEISIKSNCYISYYDNSQKYWSLYASEDDAAKIIEVLTELKVTVYESNHKIKHTGPQEPVKLEPTQSKFSEHDIESDTDSSINKKTKASILNRMANMGHSVFPTNITSVDKTSDSSDTTEMEMNHAKIVRHKPGRSTVKRNILENNIQTGLSTASQHNIATPKTEHYTDNNTIIHNTSLCRQLLPIANANLINGANSSCTNEMSLFIQEQRISNSELRINMNRITDKLDLILTKVNSLEHGGIDVQTEIFKKLLTEYENRIKDYENIIQTNQAGDCKENEIIILKQTIHTLEHANTEKNYEIQALRNDVEHLKKKCVENKYFIDGHEETLNKKIMYLENNLALKNEELTNITMKYDSITSSGSLSKNNVGNMLKNIMNDTFQTISVNFDSGELYPGETIKKIIAAVIKKITVQTLSEL